MLKKKQKQMALGLDEVDESELGRREPDMT